MIPRGLKQTKVLATFETTEVQKRQHSQQLDIQRTLKSLCVTKMFKRSLVKCVKIVTSAMFQGLTLFYNTVQF